MMQPEDDLYLEGDLYQMGTQKSFLSEMGFHLRQSDVYPIVLKEDVILALKAIWDNKVEGWWHYKEKYVGYEICTAEEFDLALAAQCNR